MKNSSVTCILTDMSFGGTVLQRKNISLGIILGKEYSGKGYGTEAVTFLRNIYFRSAIMFSATALKKISLHSGCSKRAGTFFTKNTKCIL